MGNGQALSLPEGAPGKALDQMVGAQRIPITDKFWFELLKVQFPGVEQAVFFDALASKPGELDSLVYEAYFLQLVATNDHSGNLRTFLRFWARLLHYYRTSPRGGKPCEATAALSLSLLCRCLLKHFAAAFTAPTLLFQLEQAPFEASAGGAQRRDSEALSVTYCGRQVNTHRQASSEDEGRTAFIDLSPVAEAFPEDQRSLRDLSRTAFRAPSTGETLAALEAAERSALDSLQELVVCPSAVPGARNSVVRSVFRELLGFFVSSAFGAQASASIAGASAKPDAPLRNRSAAPHTLQMQVLMLEILLTLSAVIAPRFVHKNEGEEHSSRRSTFCAALHYSLGTGSVSESGKSDVQERPKKEPDMDSDVLELPPQMGEEPSLPFLDALLEVVEEGDEEDTAASDSEASQHFGGSSASSHPKSSSQRAAASGADRSVASTAWIEAVLTTLLNTIWLQPHAGSLTRPTEKTLRLFPNVTFPDPGEDPADAGVEMDPKSASKAAATAGKQLAARAPLILLLLVLYRPQQHLLVAKAFAGITEGSGPVRTADGAPAPPRGASAAPLAAPVNFALLLEALASRLQESSFAILFYCLLHRNDSFRRYCLCQSEAEVVLVPLMEAIQKALPTNTGGNTTGGSTVVPPHLTALLLALLELTSDEFFCKMASTSSIVDGGRLLGQGRMLENIAASSVLVAQLLKLIHWNFATHRHAFFNRLLAGIFQNLAVNGMESIHWYTAGRILEVAQLLAKHALKSATTSSSDAQDQHKIGMVQEALRSLALLLSGCLRFPRVGHNCSLIYALQRTYPSQFETLQEDSELGPIFLHIKSTVDWFQARCPPDENLEGGNKSYLLQLQSLASASFRAPEGGAISNPPETTRFVYEEGPGLTAYFLPEVWKEAKRLVPDHVCWSGSVTQRSG